jgi:DNA-binding MarR family transcriptional regulator
MSFSFKTPEDSPGFLLWQLTCQWQRAQRQALTKLGLTHPQFVVLACTLWLSVHSKELVKQRHVAELSKIDKMSMSDLVHTLVTKKLLKCNPHPQDGRAQALSLTTKGQERVQKAIPIVESIDAAFFDAETKRLTQLFKACGKPNIRTTA